ncbi:MAG: cytochrome c [Acidobacteriota bacterium]|nr:cytochrome c [Acidobacteriota bacterium]
MREWNEGGCDRRHQRIATPWLRSPLFLLAVAFLCAFDAIVFAGVRHGGTSQSMAGPPAVTPVRGPSNLERVGLTMETSGMGRTGRLGPPPTENPLPLPSVTYSENITRPSQLSGADLYRLDCQACHQADGNGAPPEINAIIGPVQATSAVVMSERMKKIGRPITATFALQLATDSRKDLLDRLKNGGQKMPSFGHLTGKEVQALVAYLELLARVPGAGKRQFVVTEPVVRIGELLAKGTCHICHAATGRWPDPEELLQGAVPPLGSFPTERSMVQVIRKVRYGAPVVMGRAFVPSRGRMPVFDYLKDDEVSAAYLYLLIYPPRKSE